MPEPNASPKPIDLVESMDFSECLDAVLSNKKVRRASWPDEHDFLIIMNDQLMIHKEDDLYHPLIVSKFDLLATDWVIVQGEN